MTFPRAGLLLPRYERLLAEADAWFGGALAAHAGEVQCRRGCDRCCRGLFDVTPLDARLLRRGLAEVEPGVREAILADARAVLERVREQVPGWEAPWRVGALGIERFDALCEALDEVPCPALGPDGGCRLYAHRPLVCRIHGLPMFDRGEGAWIGGECALNFPPGDPAAQPALHFDHAAFEERELALLGEAEGPSAAEDPEAAGTIVAAALLVRDV